MTQEDLLAFRVDAVEKNLDSVHCEFRETAKELGAAIRAVHIHLAVWGSGLGAFLIYTYIAHIIK